jgi:hypothetical protein
VQCDRATANNGSVAEADRDVTVREPDLEDEPLIPGGRVVVWLVIAVCVLVIASFTLLVVFKPGKKPASSKLCWDSAMQMEMPCTTAP